MRENKRKKRKYNYNLVCVETKKNIIYAIDISTQNERVLINDKNRENIFLGGIL